MCLFMKRINKHKMILSKMIFFGSDFSLKYISWNRISDYPVVSQNREDMSNKIKAYTFDTDQSKHCKSRWTFNILKKDQGFIVDSIKIEERESAKGCIGHPKTIEALLKGREINSLDINALMESDCKMGISCGQFLASCLEEIKLNLDLTVKT